MYAHVIYRLDHDNARDVYFANLIPALASLPHYPGSKVYVDDKEITVSLHDIDELICDLLRNHTKHYDIVVFSVEPDRDPMCQVAIDPEAIGLSVPEVISWVIDNADTIETSRYYLNRNKNKGKYVLDCEHMSYGFYLIEKD